MTGSLVLFNVGGIGFSLKSSRSIRFSPTIPSYDEFFISPSDKVIGKPVEIFLKISPPPSVYGLEKLFDNGNSWALYRNTSHFILVWKIPDEKKPRWVARFNENFRSVTIYCGEYYIKKKKELNVISNLFQYPLDQLLVMFVLNQRGGALVHSAGMGINSNGILFAGVSGAGKTTITRLFLKHTDAEVLSDDRIIIRKENNRYRMYGTPWPGDARIARNASLPLKNLFFLNQSPENRIIKLSPSEAIKKILPVTSIQWYEKTMMTRSLRFLEAVVKDVPSYQLDFTPEQDVVRMVRERLDPL